MGVGVEVTVGVGVEVSVGVGVEVSVGEGVAVTDGVGLAVGSALGDGVAVVEGTSVGISTSSPVLLEPPQATSVRVATVAIASLAFANLLVVIIRRCSLEIVLNEIKEKGLAQMPREAGQILFLEGNLQPSGQAVPVASGSGKRLSLIGGALYTPE